MKRFLIVPLLLIATCIVYSCNNGAYDAVPNGTPDVPNPFNPANQNSRMTANIDGKAFSAYYRTIAGLDSIPVIMGTDGTSTITLILDRDSFKYKPGNFYIDGKGLNQAFLFSAKDSTIQYAKSGVIIIGDISDSGKVINGGFNFITTDSTVVTDGIFGFWQ